MGALQTVSMNLIDEKIENLERFEEIVEILSRQQMGYVLDMLDLEDRLPIVKQLTPTRTTKPSPERVRETFEQLGPTFIKFGQMLAHRKDIIPDNYAEELKGLENKVPGFSGEEARRIFDEEVGLEKLESFDEEPIASASIAQVHRASLKSGEDVVAKIRRPGITEKVEADLRILMYLAERFDRLNRDENRQVSRSVREFSEWTKREIDLTNEARNGKRLQEIMEEWDKVRIPDIYEELSTEKVVTMEYIDAVRSDNIEELEGRDIEFEEIARIGVDSQLKQIFDAGFFHADPHPSNFMVDRNGRLVYLDFGIMGRLTRKKRKDVLVMLYSIINEDVETVIESVRELSETESDPDIEGYKYKIEKEIKLLEGTSIGEKSISKTFFNLTLEASRHGIYLPQDLIIMGKGMVTIEGIGMEIYPEYNVKKENGDYLRELMKKQLNPDDSKERFMVDMVKNRELIENLPSKMNDAIKPDRTEITVHQENSDSSVAPAILIFSGIILAFSLPQELAIYAGVVGILLAYLVHRS